MPKPDLVALTGGYRKTPVLQQGQDVYCDTRLIARIIDAFSNEQTLYPQDQAANANILAQWADQHLFGLAVALVFSPLGIDELAKKVPAAMLEALVKDRAKLRLGATAPKITLEIVLSQLPTFLQQFEHQLLDCALTYWVNSPPLQTFLCIIVYGLSIIMQPFVHIYSPIRHYGVG